jgi:hypothetical protein
MCPVFLIFINWLDQSVNLWAELAFDFGTFGFVQKQVSAPFAVPWLVIWGQFVFDSATIARLVDSNETQITN